MSAEITLTQKQIRMKFKFITTVLSAAMLLEHVGLQQEGKAVRDAVNQAIEAGVVTEDLAAAGAKACSTTEVGDFVAGHIA